MLVIISDLHLTDGTTGTTIGASAFEDFRVRLRELAMDASHRANGVYRPIESFDLVLLGDVFDLIRTTLWNDEGAAVRPWEHREKPGHFADKIAEVTAAILGRNQGALAALRACSQGKAITVPVAPGAAEQVPVPVRIHYVVGNHDWYYHLPGAAFDAIRATVNEAIGLANGPGPYPHAPEESERLMEVYRRHRIYARHGDIFDPFNYIEAKGRDAATLGDALVVDLINRFPHLLRQRMTDLPPEFVDGLDELANVRPSLLVPVWVDSLLSSSDLTRAQNHAVKRIWNELADRFTELPFVRAHDKPLLLDEVDGLEATLKLSARFSFRDIARIATFVQKRFWKGGFSYARHALKEPAFKNGTADHIVYGHTHHYEVVPLHRRYDGQHEVSQICFNSGTWHVIHERTLKSDSLMTPQFTHFHVMTYIAFFAEDERSGRRFETWSGTLGVR
ncbi:MAG: metallophosphoesterase [Anaerolineae bacterium]|nr:metallophosphoesterase [Anaerolineae bacterium]